MELGLETITFKCQLSSFCWLNAKLERIKNPLCFSIQPSQMLLGVLLSREGSEQQVAKKSSTVNYTKEDGRKSTFINWRLHKGFWELVGSDGEVIIETRKVDRKEAEKYASMFLDWK